MTTSQDPNGWVKNPPSVLVKIEGTTRESINGKLGLVLDYNNAPAAQQAEEGGGGGRYTILLTQNTNQHLSLRADKLVRANVLQQLQGQYQLLTNDPRLRQQALDLLHRVETTTGMKIKYLLVGLLTLLLVSFYFLGFSRTLLLLSFGIMVLLVIWPDMTENKPLRVMLRNAPLRIKSLVRQSQLPFCKQIAENQYLLFLLVAFVIAVFVMGMLPKQQQQLQLQYGDADTIGLPPPATATADVVVDQDVSGYNPTNSHHSNLERYYKLGFEDAANDRPFGSSLPENKPAFVLKTAPTTTSSSREDSSPSPYRHEEEVVLDDPLFDDDYHGDPTSPRPKLSPRGRRQGRQGAALLSMSNAMSAFYLFRAVDELGRVGGGGPWTWQQLIQNGRTMPVWRMALLGLSVYRLLSAVMGA